MIGAGQLGLRPTGPAGPSNAWRGVLAAVQAEMLPIEKNALRTRVGLERSLGELESTFAEVRASLRGSGRDLVRGRETAAMLQMARWACESALARRETRAMHTRVDCPATDPGQQYRLVCRGIERIETHVDPRSPQPVEGWLAA